MLIVLTSWYFLAICPPTTFRTVCLPTVVLAVVDSFISSTRTLPKRSLFVKASEAHFGFILTCLICAFVLVFGVMSAEGTLGLVLAICLSFLFQSFLFTRFKLEMHFPRALIVLFTSFCSFYLFLTWVKSSLIFKGGLFGKTVLLAAVAFLSVYFRVFCLLIALLSIGPSLLCLLNTV